jgi:protein-S-isoprenylcysteine O-methyltransferase Ste14
MAEKTPETGDQDIPRVLAPPIYVFGVALVAGLALDTLWPAALLPTPVQYLIGGILVVGAIVLFSLTKREFDRHSTPFSCYQTAQELVTTGPFEYSRNPGYLALALLYLGSGFLLDNAWILLLAIPAIAFVHYGVIAPEEKYLEFKFGKDYRAYKSRVRSWI